MTSRSTTKIKFTGGERVLCYEPDLTKAKVLYDSKVLDVVITKDSRGRKVVEYLIHFQGWNPSWDRCVHEEFVLKDTPENRQLQKDLAEQSQLQLGAYLYRRERKKHNRKVFEPNNVQLTEEGSSDSPVQTIDTEESISALSSSETDSFIDEEIISIELSEYLRNVLEHDYHLINNKNRLMKLPAELHVVTILENYWKHYCSSLLGELNQKPSRRLTRSPLKVKPEDVERNLNICKEMLDGLRIYFDFTLADLLLYKSEKGQIDVAYAKYLDLSTAIGQEADVKAQPERLQYIHQPNNALKKMFGRLQNNYSAQHARRRSLRSHRHNTDIEANGIVPDESVLHPPEMEWNSSVTNLEISEGLVKLLSWRLLPDYVYIQYPLPPSLMYGATHLLRLFVKLPELLNASGIMDNKLKTLQEHLAIFLSYLSDHKEWYGDKLYVD